MNGKHQGSVCILSQASRPHRAGALVLMACALCLVGSAARAQQPAPPVQDSTGDHTPPPKKYVPADVSQQLALAKDAKARTKLSLELSEQRLVRAATHTSAEQYEAAGRELGIYQAIVDDAIRYVQDNVKKDGKRRDLFKRMELALRAHVPRIETVRRMTPSEDAVHVKDCIEFVRNARAEALNSFYDDTVIRIPTGKNEKPLNPGAGPKSTSLDAPEKKPEQR
jgi:hypothetical protein